MTEIIFGLVIAVNSFIDKVGDKVKHLLGGCVFANVIVFARDNQRTPDALNNFVFAAAFKPDSENANIGAAEV